MIGVLYLKFYSFSSKIIAIGNGWWADIYTVDLNKITGDHNYTEGRLSKYDTISKTRTHRLHVGE
jgi:hypothetical protein